MVRSRSGVSSPGEPTRAERGPAPRVASASSSASGTGRGRGRASASGSGGAGASLLADDEIEEETLSADDHRRPATEPLPASERPFGRYHLLRRLAYGGMGEIFLARQGGVGSLATVEKLVVIKRILGHMKRDEKHRRMFLDEARLQALLNNPHIVQIHDMGEENGHVYLAMEHVHGPSWRALIDRCRKNREHIPLAHVCAMMAQAARGLSYAHNLVDVTGSPLRIVHRDINPHNILVTYDGEVKLIDFGIAKSELADGNTETGTIKGKFSYMSPEQSAALPLDARSDIFTLGICLYELITLENPFRKGNVVLSLEAIQRETPAPLAKKRKDAAVLQSVVDRCLAKDREDRFDDAGEVAVALEALLHDGVIPPAAQSLGAWLRERFTDAIAEHLHILEQTGSTGALVTRGSDASLPRRRPSLPSDGRVGPNDPTAARLDLPSPAELTVAAPEPLEAAPVELTSQTPAESYDVSSMSVVAQKPRSRVPIVAAAAFLIVVLGLGVGVAVAFAVEPEAAGALLAAAVDSVDRSAPPPIPALPTALPTPGQPPELTTAPADPGKDPPATGGADPAGTPDTGSPDTGSPDTGSPDTGSPDTGSPDTGAADTGSPDTGAPDTGSPDTGDTGATGDPGGEARDDVVAKPRHHVRHAEASSTRHKHVEPDKKPPAKPVVASVSVTSEGYAVRGGRKIYEGEATTLSINHDDGAPFTVRFKVRADSFDVDSEPWAIVRVNGLGKGRTPQRGLPLGTRRAQIELVNPAGGKMTVSLKLTPK